METLFLKYLIKPIIKAQGAIALIQLLEFDFYLSALIGNNDKTIKIIENLEQSTSFNDSNLTKRLYGSVDIIIG
ncbi:MAG: hypothetical protein U5K79_21100 [Cyclobacteriaceae bacterium]|nr:hypothetical protein [Cyclobacteriaceae bacterium]